MRFDIDESRIDQGAAPEAIDQSDMLRAVATSGAQVRQALDAAEDAGVGKLRAGDRPRALVVAGMGGSGIAGDVLAAVCGTSCPVPVIPLRSYIMPGWVGPLDLLIGVSCSGSTEETLAVVEEGVRRGMQPLTVGASDSPL